MRNGGASAQGVLAGKSCAPDASSGFNEVAGRVERECCARQAMGLGIVLAGCEPARKHAEVRRAVAASAAALIDCGHG